MNYRKIFDDYVSYQKSNEMAKLIFRTLIEDPLNDIPSPILLIGDSGTGKTHLVDGVLAGFSELYPEKKVVFFRAEEFANRLVTIYRNGNHEDASNFKFECWSRTALLVMEDIHFLFNKKKLLEEMIRTVDYLVMKSSCKVILTSVIDPKACPDIHPRIVSRMIQGLTLHLQKADYTERREILKRLCQEKGLELPTDVEEYICVNVLSVRRLIGVVNRLCIHGQGKVDITVNESSIMIRDLVTRTNDLNCCKIIEEVALYYGYSPQELLSKKRDEDIVLARQIAEYLAFCLIDCTLSDLAKCFGRDRSTIRYCIDKIKEECNKSPAMQGRIEELIRLLVPEQGR